MADKLYVTRQEDMLDLIAWRYYGRSSGVVEAILARNFFDEARTLSERAEVLEAAKLIILPELANPSTQRTVNLWD
ncbi:MAG: tail protein X [Bacteroidota bacterium]